MSRIACCVARSRVAAKSTVSGLFRAYDSVKQLIPRAKSTQQGNFPVKCLTRANAQWCIRVGRRRWSNIEGHGASPSKFDHLAASQAQTGGSLTTFFVSGAGTCSVVVSRACKALSTQGTGDLSRTPLMLPCFHGLRIPSRLPTLYHSPCTKVL